MHLVDWTPYALLTTCGRPCCLHSWATSAKLRGGPRACHVRGHRGSHVQRRAAPPLGTIPVGNAGREAGRGRDDGRDAVGAVRGNVLGHPLDVGGDLVAVAPVWHHHELKAWRAAKPAGRRPRSVISRGHRERSGRPWPLHRTGRDDGLEARLLVDAGPEDDLGRWRPDGPDGEQHHQHGHARRQRQHHAPAGQQCRCGTCAAPAGSAGRELVSAKWQAPSRARRVLHGPASWSVCRTKYSVSLAMMEEPAALGCVAAMSPERPTPCASLRKGTLPTAPREPSVVHAVLPQRRPRGLVPVVPLRHQARRHARLTFAHADIVWCGAGEVRPLCVRPGRQPWPAGVVSARANL